MASERAAVAAAAPKVAEVRLPLTVIPFFWHLDTALPLMVPLAPPR
jgi:hypothetical protein